MRTRYPNAVRKFVQDNSQGNSPAVLAQMINENFGTTYTYLQIRAYLKNNKIRTGVKKGHGKKASTELYSLDVREYIQKNHKGCAGNDMAERLNLLFGTRYTGSQIRSYYKNNRINSGCTGRFEKGHVSVNKGKHSAGGPPHTLFRKGEPSYNKMPIGTEILNSQGYLVRKVADPNVWKFVHRIIWEESNGEVPPGHCIIFADQNHANFSLDNLILVSRAQKAVLNTKKLNSEFAELTRAGLMVTNVILRMGEVKRKGRRTHDRKERV